MLEEAEDRDELCRRCGELNLTHVVEADGSHCALGETGRGSHRSGDEGEDGLMRGVTVCSTHVADRDISGERKVGSSFLSNF